MLKYFLRLLGRERILTIYPLYFIKFFGMAHPGQRTCASLVTDGLDLTAIEYGYEPIHLGRKQLVQYTNELIGDKSSIEEYVSQLKSGKIENVDSKGVHYVAPFEGPIQIGDYNKKYWARIKVIFIYEMIEDGFLPLSSEQQLKHFTSLVIYDGKEYCFLKSGQNLRSGQVWSAVKEGLRNSNVVAEVDKLTSFGSKEPVFKESRMFQLLGGAFSVHPWIIGSRECLRPHYLVDLLSSVQGVITRRNRLKGSSVLDYLENWSPLQEELFRQLYFDGIFRSKVLNIQNRSLRKFHEKLGKKATNPHLKSLAYKTLTYHCEVIQNTLDLIHDRFIVGETGLETELVFGILQHKTTAVSLPSLIDDDKTCEGGEEL